jgi:WD40 repeat protein
LAATSASNPAIPVRLLSYTSEGGQKIWDRETGKLIASAVANPNAAAAALSPDGRKFFIRPSGEKSVRQLDTMTGAAVGPSIPAKAQASAIALTQDGSKLVVGTDLVQIWDVRTATPIGAPLHDFSSPIATSFSPAGQVAAGGIDRGDIAIWTPSTGALVILKGHTDSVTALAFAHNRDEVVSLSSDNTGRIWNAKTGKPGPILPLGNGTLDAQVEYSPDDRLILTKSARKVLIWDARTGLLQQQLSSEAISAGWSPDGKTVLIITDKGPQIVGWLFGEALRAQACDNRPRDFTDDERRAYGLGPAEKPCDTVPAWRRALDWAF